MESQQRIIEVERVVNMLKGFGWDLVSTSSDATTLIITVKKVVTPQTVSTAV